MKIVQEYPTMVGQTRITCCRDLDFPFPTTVVHESPFSTMEQNKTGWIDKIKVSLVLLKKTHQTLLYYY